MAPTQEKLTQEISRLILKIETEYPELYSYLDEDISGMQVSNVDVSDQDLIAHLKSLKAKLQHYKEMHLKKE